MPADSSALFKPSKLGAFTLEHGVVLAPLTRFRNDMYIPGRPMQAEYYGQRASKGGLLVSEGVLISPGASSYIRAPGIWNDEQIAGWRKITDAVHAKGGIIFAQLWHLGRNGNRASWEYEGKTYRPVAMSAIPSAEGEPVPEALTLDGIEGVKADFAQAARNAIQAGFDGVECHGANGYLGDSALQEISNKRTDKYGGSLENRLRFPLEVAKAVADAVGGERVGYRISPFGTVGGVGSSKPMETFAPFVEQLLKVVPNLAYVHAVEPRIDGMFDREIKPDDNLNLLRSIVKKSPGGTRFISAGGHTPETAVKLASETGDLVAFGRYFIANPDLPARIRNGWPLTKYHRDSFYGRDEKGYTDYPFYEEKPQPRL